jgi:putative ABC transport system permease protein
MTSTTLIARSLRYYWRTHLAVVAGVATAVAVLAGALLVGASVKDSLRALALARLGRTDLVAAGTGFFRDSLAADVAKRAAADGQALDVAPVIVLEGTVSAAANDRTAHRVQVVGVDARFWRFHHADGLDGPSGRDAFLSPALRDELSTSDGDALMLTVQRSADIPPSLLPGRRDDLVRTIRLVSRAARTTPLLEFALRPEQGAVRTAFVPLARLQRELDRPNQVNALLVSSATDAPESVGVDRVRTLLHAASAPEDLGIQVRTADAPSGTLIVESTRGYLSDVQAQAVRDVAVASRLNTEPVLTYLANSLRIGDRTIPYSLVAGVEGQEPGTGSPEPGTRNREPGIRNPEPESLDLNDWAANDLRATPSDPIALEYYVWTDAGGLETRGETFRVGRVLPMDGRGGDRSLTPDYPGLTDEARIGDWDPPFPVDLSRIRPRDEDYWARYRAAPKAFVPLARAQRLWGSRFGRLTSMRLTSGSGFQAPGSAFEIGRAIVARLDPVSSGAFAILPVRQDALAAARGRADFGEYFLYFSFFLVLSALLLAALFFRLGIEQRWREVGLLAAVGFPPSSTRRLFLGEAAVLSSVGATVGALAAIGYAALVLLGLRTWWIGAVGTSNLDVHLSSWPLGVGGLAGVVVALAAIAVTLRGLRNISPRSLLSGDPSTGRTTDAVSPTSSRARWLAVLTGAGALALIIAAAADLAPRLVSFFLGGSLLLASALFALAARLRAAPATPIVPGNFMALARLGFRSATARPGRTVLSAALIAVAAFVIVAVSAFRLDGAEDRSRHGGTGGYAFVAEAAIPLLHDPASASGLGELGLTPDALHGVRLARFRLKPGDDSSCLNLYRPTDPRIVGASSRFIAEARFSFSDTIPEKTPGATSANPWTRLEGEFPDGALPAIADATSLTYVFHLAVGDDLVVPSASGRPIRLRIVAALADSLFQSELIISERHFVRAFPSIEGYRFFLIDAPRREDMAGRLEGSFRDYGLDVEDTAVRLAAFHRVENTYISTFQALGGLGLILGTLGVGAVLMRNVLERQRELALLGAVGFRAADVSLIILSETALIVLSGVAIGVVSALVAIAPAVLDRGSRLPLGTLTLVVAGVIAAALVSSLGATLWARRLPIVETLRTE